MYASAPAICVANTAPLSLQVLAALVSQLCTGTRSLLIWTIEVCLAPRGIDASFKAVGIQYVEAVSAEVFFKAKP